MRTVTQSLTKQVKRLVTWKRTPFGFLMTWKRRTHFCPVSWKWHLSSPKKSLPSMQPSRTLLNGTLPPTFDFPPAQLLIIGSSWAEVVVHGRNSWGAGLPRHLTWTSPTATRDCPMTPWPTQVTRLSLRLLRLALSWIHHQAWHRLTMSLHLCGKTLYRQAAPLPWGWIDGRWLKVHCLLAVRC